MLCYRMWYVPGERFGPGVVGVQESLSGVFQGSFVEDIQVAFWSVILQDGKDLDMQDWWAQSMPSMGSPFPKHH